MEKFTSLDTHMSESAQSDKANQNESHCLTEPPLKRLKTSESRQPEKQLKVDTIMSLQRSYEDGAAEANRRLVYMISKDKMPFQTVEKEGFKTFINFIAPLYKIPSRKVITDHTGKTYKQLSRLIKGKLSEIDDISITADIWTDTNKCKSYLGFTTHFIENGTHKSIMIGVKDLDERHTAENIERWFNEILNEWEIRKDAVIIVVTDNAANIKKGAIDCFGQEKWLPCFAHTLNLVPAVVFEHNKNVRSIITKVKEIVTFFKSSTAAADELRKQSDLILIQCNNTRWGSTYKMLKRYEDLSEIIIHILLVKMHNNAKAPKPVMGEDLTTIKEMMMLLEPLAQATEIICGENYVTGSESLPLIKNLSNTLSALPASTATSKEFKKALTEEFDKRFKNMEYLVPIGIATMLDPRYKRLYFKDNIANSMITNKITEKLNEWTAGTGHLNVVDEKASNAQENTDPNTEITSEDNFKLQMWTYDNMLREKLKASKTIDALNRPRTEMSEEFKYYLSQDPISRSDNPIEYWMKMPNSMLSKLALRYLTVIATSVPTERLFSQASLILTEKRSQLSVDHFQQLLFLTTLSEEYWFLNNVQ